MKELHHWQGLPWAGRDSVIDEAVADFIDAYARGGRRAPALEPFAQRGTTSEQTEKIASLCSLFLEIAEAPPFEAEA